MQIPPRSGDLNPIENMWAQVTKDLGKFVVSSQKWKKGRKPTTKSKADWQKVVLRKVKAQKASFLTNLSSSMPRRVKAVLDNDGGPTGY